MIAREELEARLKNIKIVILDVDGVLTDCSIVLNGSDEWKSFSAMDGHGMRLLTRHGVKVSIITGRRSKAVERRANELGVTDLYQEAKFKLPPFHELLERHGLTADEALYVGDDLPDIPPMRHAAVGVAVASAHEETLARADWVTQRPGGRGAVREIADMILKAQGKWDEVMARYLDDALACGE